MPLLIGEFSINRMDKLEGLEGIKRGVADVEAGRVTPLKEFEK
jgi:hypothetical protein